MDRRRRQFLLRLAAVAVVASPLAPSTTARAQPAAAAGPEIEVSAAWSRAASQGTTGAGYMVLHNRGTTPDRIVSASSPVARTVELHTHVHEGGVMRMRPVPAIDLPAGQEVRLAPGGLHLMLIGLNRPLREGERVPVTLTLERGGSLTVELEVMSARSRGPAPSSAPMGHGHGGGASHAH